MVQQLEVFDIAMRFTTIGILSFVSVIVIRDAGQVWAGRLTAMFTLSVCSYLLCSSSIIRAMLGAWLPLLHLACTATPFFLWLAAQAIFVDGFRPRATHWLALAAFEALGVSILYVDSSYGPLILMVPLNNVVRIGLLSHAMWGAWRGRNDDLVEARRQARGRFVFAAATLSLIVVSVEIAVGRMPAPVELETMAAVAILVITGMLTPSVMRLNMEKIFPPTDRCGVIAGWQNSVLEGRSSAERATLSAIRQAIEVNRIFRDPGLTIASFAAQVRTPEYRLRRIIHDCLGFRNFNAFLNHYRIVSVKETLADNNQSRVPILTIAMDAGFASIAPFNKAFRELTGETPSAFRARLADNESPADDGDSG